MKKLVLILAFAGGLIAPAPTAAQRAPHAESEVVLMPGDAVRITVWRSDELSGEFSIAEDGSIGHPLYREIRISGLTLPAAEERIHSFLRTLESSPKFVVQPLIRISVGGEVRQPSLYQLPPETTIGQAIAVAGGATERGRLERVRLFRGGEEIEIDLTRPEAGMAQERIRSGDQIFVNRKISLFREYIAPGVSLTASLASLISIILR